MRWNLEGGIGSGKIAIFVLFLRETVGCLSANGKDPLWCRREGRIAGVSLSSWERMASFAQVEDLAYRKDKCSKGIILD